MRIALNQNRDLEKNFIRFNVVSKILKNIKLHKNLKFNVLSTEEVILRGKVTILREKNTCTKKILNKIC